MSNLLPSSPLPGTEDNESFGVLVLAVRQSLLRNAERLLSHCGYDLNLTQFRALSALGRCGPLGASELARTIELDAGALTRLIDGLQDKGYVVRRPHPNDRRAIEVSLTEAGQHFLDQARPTVQTFYDDLMNVLPPHEQQQLFSAMRRLRAKLDQQLNELS